MVALAMVKIANMVILEIQHIFIILRLCQRMGEFNHCYLRLIIPCKTRIMEPPMEVRRSKYNQVFFKFRQRTSTVVSATVKIANMNILEIRRIFIILRLCYKAGEFNHCFLRLIVLYKIRTMEPPMEVRMSKNTFRCETYDPN